MKKRLIYRDLREFLSLVESIGELKTISNVHWDKEAGGYRADCSGRVRLSGKILDVDEILIIKNGVGTESGNLRHNGKIVIGGDVEMNFSVEATGDIEVSGVIYASDITAGGSLTARGGINGDPGRRIVTVGDIIAKYIMNSTIELSGNIITKNEIVQSTISTTGTVNCSGGRIIGGQILATKGITVGEAGSKNNTPTTLIAGVDHRLHQELKANSSEISRLKKTIKKLDEANRRLNANLHLLNHGQKEKLIEIQFKIIEGEEEITRLETVNKAINAKIQKNSHVRIEILELVHPGVVLRICDMQYAIEHTLAGPVVASLDRIKHEIVLSSELDVKDGAPNEA